MWIQQASEQELETVKQITVKTIRAVYPHYYPAGAVEFFVAHHNTCAISEDIRQGSVFLLWEGETPVGTVTCKQAELCRLFVLPQWQGRGAGACLIDFAEQLIAQRSPVITLDASLPAKPIYQKRGYAWVTSHNLPVTGGDILCYDVMQKQLNRACALGSEREIP